MIKRAVRIFILTLAAVLAFYSYLYVTYCYRLFGFLKFLDKVLDKL